MNKLFNLIIHYQQGEDFCMEEILCILSPSLNYIKKKFNNIEIYDELFCSVPFIISNFNADVISNYSFDHAVNYLKKSIINKGFSIAKRLKNENDRICYNSEILNVKTNDISQSCYIDSDIEFLDLIKNLSNKEQFVIKSYFKDQETVVSISEKLHISRQGVNKIKNNALNKLKYELLHC